MDADRSVVQCYPARQARLARQLLLHSDGASSLSWDVLQYIYSHCDTFTLAVLCLVSFESWEMAGPFLYEHVELKSIDGVKAFFFLVSLRLARNSGAEFMAEC